MSREMQEEKQREFRIKLNDLKTKEKRYKEEIRMLNLQIMDRLQRETVEVAEKIGKREGFLLIIDKGVVLYAPNSIDITNRFIQEYDAQFKSDPKTSSSGAEE